MIRRAKTDDLETIQELNKLLFEKEESDYDPLLNSNWPFEEEGKDYFEKTITDENKIAFVAEVSGDIVGYMAGAVKKQSVYKGHCLEAEIDNMFILESHRNSGIGSDLVENFVIWAKGLGAKRIEVRASSGNGKGIRFYKKNGFEDFDVVLKKDL